MSWQAPSYPPNWLRWIAIAILMVVVAGTPYAAFVAFNRVYALDKLEGNMALLCLTNGGQPRNCKCWGAQVRRSLKVLVIPEHRMSERARVAVTKLANDICDVDYNFQLSTPPLSIDRMQLLP